MTDRRKGYHFWFQDQEVEVVRPSWVFLGNYWRATKYSWANPRHLSFARFKVSWGVVKAYHGIHNDGGLWLRSPLIHSKQWVWRRVRGY